MIGSGVWIEFEQGDIDYPIWSGVYWGSAAEVPALSHLLVPGVPGIAIQTVLQNGLILSDVPGPTGGIMLMSTDRRHDPHQRRRHHDLKRPGRHDPDDWTECRD